MIKLMAKIRFDTPEETHEETLYHNIVSVDVEALDRGNVTDVINWGVYANRGSLSFIDRNGTINGMLEKHRVIDVQVFLADNSDEILLATMDASDFFYNVDTGQIDLELSDKLDALQNKSFARIYPFKTTSIFNLAQSVFINQAGLSLADWASATNNYALETMVAVNIHCPDLQARNVWDAITQLCETAMLRVYSDPYGKPYIAGISSVSPDSKSRPIIIRSRNILSHPKKVPRHKTQVLNPKISLTNRTKKEHSAVAQKEFQLYDYDTQTEPVEVGGTYINIANNVWSFVGGDVEKNPNIKITEAQQDDYGYEIDANVTFDIDTVTNTHKISEDSGFETLATMHDETDPSTKWTNQERSMKNTSYTFDFPNQKLSITFTLPRSFYAGRHVVTDAITRIYGDYYEDVASDTGETSLDTTNLTSNSLMQTRNTANGNDYGEWYTNEIINRYGDGVVCCELECGFSNYYYEDGTPAKLTSQNINDIFGKYDVVQPYVTRGGIEVPLATYDDGSPMSFIIIGIKYHYEGIAKQTLYLQEYREV